MKKLTKLVSLKLVDELHTNATQINLGKLVKKFLMPRVMLKEKLLST